MKRLALIGHPIAHSLSPAMHNAALQAMQLDACYEAWDVLPAELTGALERLRNEADLLGLNVTVPHKQAVMPLLDSLSPEANAIGAVNCITKDAAGKLTGHNTDEYGFIRSLREAGCEPRGLRAVLLGVGGSSRAVAHGLASAGATSITLAGRKTERVAESATRLRATAQDEIEVAAVAWQDEPFMIACRQAELIVNCTPIGMRHTQEEDASPLPQSLLRPGLWVADLVYNPLETRLLREARAAGAGIVTGLEMLVYQAAASLQLWTGSESPVDIMREAARQGLNDA